MSSQAEVERRWRERYIPSQQLYFATVHPTDHADIIVHNDEPQQPVLTIPLLTVRQDSTRRHDA